MFDRLAEAIRETEVPPDAAALVEVLGLQDQLAARVLGGLGVFDAVDGWAPDGATSLTAWLRHHVGMANRDACHVARMAKYLHRLPVSAAAHADGRLSSGQLEAIVAHLSERTVGRFAEQEAGLVPSLVPLPTTDVITAMERWRALAEDELDEKEPPEHVRSLHLSPSLDRRWHGSLTLDDEAGTVVATAVRLASTGVLPAAGEAERSPARQRADALVEVCQFFLDNQRTKPGGRHRPHLNIVITADDLANDGPGRLVDGGLLPSSSVDRLLCDCNVHRVVIDSASAIVDYGRSTRTAPAPLFNALVVRDQHCRHPGCDRPASWCEAHHVVHWRRGGETNLTNLVLKCSRHHHLGHQPGWSEVLESDGTLIITDPSGRRHVSHPPGMLELRTAA
jgi:hypothetical protein